MQYIVLAALLSACVLADVQPQYYSFSDEVGSGNGFPYSLKGQGKITAVRVWDVYGNYIAAFQFCYGYIWSPVVGRQYGLPQEMKLHDDESIIQISGKYSHFVQSVVFTTTKGRTLHAGQPSGKSFNMYAPVNSMSQLVAFSGRYQGYITSFQAHWGIPPSNSTALY
ncbi:zymogen granule membrane protein 16-like [Notolabrus celidotus]|uniref:zymogen granule membrane protein 16-like n=1 Tax=Notolabrus celidotus TaxID=1203425 RepID=UPI0014906640|nr:zymogen granule membrane protein 16-like [Notolabrus celidotus]XP_034560167.1 zymogen granule membrane protein 16-like [Notolabrus celidotus]